VKRFEVTEIGREPLPAIDLAEDVVVLGSSASARVRLPANVASPAHVRIERGGWVAIDAVVVDGKSRAAGEGGAIGDAIVFELGGYRVRVADAPANAPASSPQRTESLARELVRGLLGAGAAPSFEHVGNGTKRELPPPEAMLVIGRGDEAGWIILDEDLSREHAEIRRGWDGVTIRDLDSKNGTVVDGERIEASVELHDGARIELGNVVLVFRDPAERHLRGEPAPVERPPKPGPLPQPPAPVPSPLPFVIAAAIAGLAAVGLVWVLVA